MCPVSRSIRKHTCASSYHYVLWKSTKSEPTTAQRYRSETEKNILEDLLSSVLSQFKNYLPCGNPKFYILGIFQGMKFCILMKKKILLISLKLNSTPNTLGCCGSISGSDENYSRSKSSIYHTLKLSVVKIRFRGENYFS